MSNSIVLRPAEREDIARLADIADAAFQSDAHTKLKALASKPSAFRDGMYEALGIWRTHRKIDLIVAENQDNHELMGWVAWSRRGFPGDSDSSLPAITDEDSSTIERGKTIKDLEALTNASISSWSTRLMPPGSRCRYIVAISVDPASQSSGIGSRLVRWGTEKADGEPGVYCWVQSSMGGRPFFEKHGFAEVGRLELDLDEYSEGLRPSEGAESAGGAGATWGKYIWTYMRRDAIAQ
ncbi:hypothetical protein V5O48_016598 [Marasmius crinis-equi]|uniref:N-acetyltransferase domain-containing protein n=1 Tax=Marasmius crinis-equi TaxID=585013 RepID=A0ABR3ER94_9AGAR